MGQQQRLRGRPERHQGAEVIITGQHYLDRGHWADAYGWPIDPGAPYETDGIYIWRAGLKKPALPGLYRK